MPCEAEELKRICERIPSSNMGVLTDFAHAKVTSQWLKCDKYEFIEKVKDKVFAFHAHENDGYADKHEKLDATSWCLEVIDRKCFIGLPIILEALKLTINEITQQVGLIETILERKRRKRRG